MLTARPVTNASGRVCVCIISVNEPIKETVLATKRSEPYCDPNHKFYHDPKGITFVGFSDKVYQCKNKK